MKALQYGLGAEIVPVLHVDGVLIANPLVHPANAVDAFGRPIGGDFVVGAAAESAKQKLKTGRVDLATLDQSVDRLVTKFLMTMPNCLSKTIQSMRKHKLAHWDKNRETNRAWLALNMMTEAKAGFRAFHEGVGKDREVDFVLLRQKLAAGQSWVGPLHDEIQPAGARKG